MKFQSQWSVLYSTAAHCCLHSLSCVIFFSSNSHNHAQQCKLNLRLQQLFTWRWALVIRATRQLFKSFFLWFKEFCASWSRNLTLLLSLKFIRKAIPQNDYLLFSFLHFFFVCFLVHRKPNVNCLSKHILFLVFVVLLVLCPSIVLRNAAQFVYFLHWTLWRFLLSLPARKIHQNVSCLVYNCQLRSNEKSGQFNSRFVGF